MSDNNDKAIKTAKNGADRLVLAEVHQRLDWVGVGSVIASKMQDLEKEGFIQDWRFSNLKVNGTWYKDL